MQDAPAPKPLPAGPYPVAAQQALLADITSLLGLPPDASRLDVSAHPFSTLIGPGDARITVRYDAADFTKALFGAVHETGHALYSLGHDSGDGRHGTPMGEFASLGEHESQSRLWENQVARSLPFWEHVLPWPLPGFRRFRAFPPEEVFAAVGAIRPGLIRVDADETTYYRISCCASSWNWRWCAAIWPSATCRWPGTRNPGRSRARGAARRRGLPAGRALVHGRFRLFPHLQPGQRLRPLPVRGGPRALPGLDADGAGGFQPLLAWLRPTSHEKGRLSRPRT